MVTIASWNVNSVKARLPHLLEWLEAYSPDIVLLQELKCEEKSFPRDEIENLGYNIAGHYQKTYNGVAILSKHPIEDVSTILSNDPDPLQSRYIEAVITIGTKAFRVASVYVPNGGEVDSQKFFYKLAFLEALISHAKILAAYNEALIIGGDFNVALEEIDNFSSDETDVLFDPRERRLLHKFMHIGFHDSFRTLNPSSTEYSWWDYRANSFNRNLGVRIDYLFVSHLAADMLLHASIDREMRAKERPSDHVPVICELALK